MAGENARKGGPPRGGRKGGGVEAPFLLVPSRHTTAAILFAAGGGKWLCDGHEGHYSSTVLLRRPCWAPPPRPFSEECVSYPRLLCVSGDSGSGKRDAQRGGHRAGFWWPPHAVTAHSPFCGRWCRTGFFSSPRWHTAILLSVPMFPVFFLFFFFLHDAASFSLIPVAVVVVFCCTEVVVVEVFTRVVLGCRAALFRDDAAWDRCVLVESKYARKRKRCRTKKTKTRRKTTTTTTDPQNPTKTKESTEGIQ